MMIFSDKKLLLPGGAFKCSSNAKLFQHTANGEKK